VTELAVYVVLLLADRRFRCLLKINSASHAEANCQEQVDSVIPAARQFQDYPSTIGHQEAWMMSTKRRQMLPALTAPTMW